MESVEAKYFSNYSAARPVGGGNAGELHLLRRAMYML